MIATSFKDNKPALRREATRIIKNWIDAVQTRNIEKVLPFYASNQDNFVFIHNNSEKIATNALELREAYEDILDVDSIDIIYDESSLNIPTIKDNILTCIGKHFVAIRKKTKTVMDLMHFSMTLEVTPRGLKILHHHSAFPIAESHVYTMESDEDLEPWPFYLKFGKGSLHRTFKALKDETPTVDPLLN